METELREQLRKIPGVDAVASALASDPLAASPEVVIALIRRELEALRRDILESGRSRAGRQPLPDPSLEGMTDRVRRRFHALAALRPEPVINATGVLVHTNLGRSPLSDAAVAAVSRVGSAYSDLEFDREEGRRGSRQDHVRDLLCLLTGAEDALVVNNNAAAVLLLLGATAAGREVVISRGELVEIGGSFRIPEVLEQSGARLREVGATNRTHLRDYAGAVGPETALLLKVHTSNYRVVGFTASVDLADLVRLGREHHLPVAVDLGSGALLDVGEAGVHPEPVVREVLAAGPDLVTFSGDKMLGGPQAGIVVGKASAIASLRRHPLARAVRIDKILLAALHATLLAYLEPDRAREEIPVLRMLFEPASAVEARARSLAAASGALFPPEGVTFGVEAGPAAVGGGSLPGEGIPSFQVVAASSEVAVSRWERELRRGRPAVLARIRDDRLLLDPRTIAPPEQDRLPGLLLDAWRRAGGADA